MPIVELVVFFTTPFVASWLVERRGLGWLDPVLTCYAVGLLLANTPYDVDGEVTKLVTEAVVPLAIPLLLFQTDFRRWLRSSRSTLTAFVVGVSSVFVSVATMSFLFRGAHPHLWMAAGMFTGTWTGGSPNLVSVGAALEAPHDTFILTNAADVLIGGVYLFALLTFARPLFARVMPEPEEVEPLREADDTPAPLGDRMKRGAVASGLAVAIVAASAGFSMLAFGELSAPWVILGITTGGIAASFSERIRSLDESYAVGNYLILVFCVAIGALTDLAELVSGGSAILGFGAAALAMTLLLHYTVCALLRVDVDTAIITSVSTVMGPALVVPVAKRLNNRIAFVSGITCGLVGYAMGNYAGIAMAEMVKAWLG
jgi:uncharacterized membrane protein